MYSISDSTTGLRTIILEIFVQSVKQRVIFYFPLILLVSVSLLLVTLEIWDPILVKVVSG